MGIRQAEQVSGICYRHAGVRAENICSRCNRPICEVCSTPTLDGITCPGCAVREAGNRRARHFVVGVLAFAAVAGLIVYLIQSKPQRAGVSSPDAGAQAAAAQDTVIDGFDYEQRALLIRTHQEVLRRNPCDGPTAVKLGEEMVRAQNHRGALELVEQYEKDCGEHRRLLWVSFSAHKALGDFAGAEEVATRLVEARPTDSDYWWWRGEVRMKLGDREGALLDYRQSMANRPNKFAASRLADEIGPCPGAFAHALYVREKPEPSRRWAEEEAGNLLLSGSCGRLAGMGFATVAVDSGIPLTVTRAKVGGKTGKFAISRSSGTVALSSAFAKRAKVVGAEPQVRIYVAGAFTSGRLATLDRVQVGEAVASEVPAAIVEEVPEGLDGVLGLSFLWRFATVRTPEAIEILGRQEATE